jgi:hypothetical protein
MRRDPAIDEYLAGVSPSSRALLQKLRKTVRSIVPDVLHFGPDKPLPASLVRRLLKARIAEAKHDI